MYFYAAVISTLALLGLTSAVPTPDPSPAELAPRACTTITPSFVATISKQFPDSQSTTYSRYGLGRTNGPGSNNESAVFRFDGIPSGATGCMLEFKYGRGQSLATGANDASLFTVRGQVNERTTWNNYPVKDTKVSSLQFPTSPAPADFRTIVYSSTCPSSGSVSFLLEMSDWQQNAGSISFHQTYISGFSMIYNC